MTEAEMPRLLSELSDTATALNRESDSVNELLKQFEAKLQSMKLGLEAWTAMFSSESDEVVGEDRDGEKVIERRSADVELGFAKLDDEWQLAVRHALYRKTDSDWGVVRQGSPSPLLDASRELRFGALRSLPNLVKGLQVDAKMALATIQQAKKIVK